MDNQITANETVCLRKIESADLPVLTQFEYSVSITEPHSDLARITEIHAQTTMWQDESGAVAIVDRSKDVMVGTLQFYRSAPCIHGLELGYVVHDPNERRKGYASQALSLLSDYLMDNRTQFYRQQLIIEVWNTASWKVAERAGFIREGILRSCGFGTGDPADCFIYSRTRKDYTQSLASNNGPG